MGREARLRASGVISKYREWIVAIKNDFSYSTKEIVDGQEVVTRVEQFRIVPLCGNSGIVSARTMAEVVALVNKVIDELPEEVRTKKDSVLFTADIYALELRNPIGDGRRFGPEWYKSQVVSAEKVTFKPRFVGRLL